MTLYRITFYSGNTYLCVSHDPNKAFMECYHQHKELYTDLDKIQVISTIEKSHTEQLVLPKSIPEYGKI